LYFVVGVFVRFGAPLQLFAHHAQAWQVMLRVAGVCKRRLT
jgi:hypothetical protein